MKKINLGIFGLLLALMFCGSPKKVDDTETTNADSNFRAAKEVPVNDGQSLDSPDSKEVEKTYYKITNPDTALVYFLYETYSEFKPFQYQGQYQRVDLEYDQKMALFKRIFSEKKDYDQAIKAIELNRKRFIDTIREVVYEDYKKYHGVTGMSFDFLVKRNDSLVKPLLYKLVQDDKAPPTEVDYAKGLLLEKYQDSIFMKD